MNIKLVYLYRDAGNYRSWAEVVFANPANLSLGSVMAELRRSFMQDGLFIAHQIRLPEAQFYRNEEVTLDDHCFHEFDSVDLTGNAPNDTFGRSINEFLTEVTREARAGWRAFEPQERCLNMRICS